jgi:hypothetical protein
MMDLIMILNNKSDSKSLNVEQLADYAHKTWSNWMKYLFEKSELKDDGSVIIPKDLVNRWKRQLDTKYEDLTIEEQDSDIKEANKIIEIIGSKPASQKEYDKSLLNNYNKDFVKTINKYDKMSEDMIGTKPIIETSGNLFIKYIETKDSIYVLGMSSNKGRIERSDIKDMNLWLDKLEKKIKEGKVVYTSTNSNSENFINNLLKKNPSFKKENMGYIEFPEGKWNTIKISANEHYDESYIIDKEIKSSLEEEIEKALNKDYSNEDVENFLKKIMRNDSILKETISEYSGIDNKVEIYHPMKERRQDSGRTL